MTGNNGSASLIVKMENITMRFGRVTALEAVDFEVRPQEVMALLGDNGAGKSTLIKVLNGVHTATTGEIYF
jgi:monosaccharide-transporting ATPase